MGMKFFYKYMLVQCLIAFLALSGSQQALAASCSVGNGEPPFLSFGVKSNLLLLIDNSGSMLDPAYVFDDGDDTTDDSQKKCFDDTFDPAESHGGYFTTTTWYTYNSTDNRFDTSGANSCDSYTYKNDDVCLSIDSTSDPDMVTSFSATGNFLNWATASKFDIEKKILTGGKFETDGTSSWLTMESRGCLDRRFIKKVAVVDSADTSYFLTLGIRPPSDAEQTADSVDSSSVDTTRLEIFAVTSDGFDFDSCQDAIVELNSDNPILGNLYGSTRDCMGVTATDTDADKESFSAMNHSLQECWYFNKHGEWQPGAGSVLSLKGDCEGYYDFVNPPEITTDSKGYVCYGDIGDTTNILDTSDDLGYMGRCWDSGAGGVAETCTAAGYVEGDTWKVTGTNYRCESGIVEYCAGKFTTTCEADNWVPSIVGGSIQYWLDTEGDGFVNGSGDSAYDCLDQALQDYCGIIEIPEVIDPSDAQDDTGTVYNAPAVLIDSGVVAQLDEPLAVLRGRITWTNSDPPTGILHSTANDLRIGAMAFNDAGSATECVDVDTTDAVEQYCPTDNKDGGSVISEIMLGSQNTGTQTHVEDIADAINDVRATSWTPLAEAMYNAIGYYTQDTYKRLDPSDFSTTTNPITNWCQENHILIITEGASTADQNQQVIDYVNNFPINDDASDSAADQLCTDGLQGSSYLDDLTYIAQYGPISELYPVGNRQLASDDGTMMDKQNITTHIVVSGTLRDTGATECSPDELMREAATNGGTTLMESANPIALEQNLLDTLNDLRKRASAGSAASVISSARGGEGAIYQAIFWPDLTKADDTATDWSVKWVGDLHALFIDTNGYMYEDTDGNRKMEPTEDGGLDGGDKRVIVYFDTDANRSKACYNTSILDSGTCTSSVELSAVKFLWAANDWLAKISNLQFSPLNYDVSDIYLNRSTYISNEPRRHIFTWVDLDNDGVVDEDANDSINEVRPFVERDSGGAELDWAGLGVSGGRGGLVKDFAAADNDEVRDIISWVRGADASPYRSRQIPVTDGSSTFITWRLGDIIHSTPMTVASPAEGYHLLYNDQSYARFVSRYKRRRHVVYFGANDGMLHAANAGFYSEKEKMFCLVPLNADGTCSDTSVNAPELGAELWSYVPYNLLPHLKCLTDPEYEGIEHKYYVDLRPRIFDAKIFEPEAACATDHRDAACIHPEGWGTILVGGMRFGGAPLDAQADLGQTSDNRRFISSYFVLDITNPEQPPVLLGETTQTLTDSDSDTVPDAPVSVDLGYSTVIPTMVIMKDDSTSPVSNDWYLVFGSGPHGDSDDALMGISDQEPKVSIVYLNDLVDSSTNKAGNDLRISASLPAAGTPEGTIGLATGSGNGGISGNGFVSDPITVDFDINPSFENYKADAVYFGTVEGDFDAGSPPSYWDGGGVLYRLVTREMTLGESEYGQGVTENVTEPADWAIKPMIDLSAAMTDSNGESVTPKAITASPAVATDGRNFWIYFGTGRYFDVIDKTDDRQQTYFGIKEPMVFTDPSDCANTSTTKQFTWEKVELTSSGTDPGQKGLVDVSDILTEEAVSPALSNLSCRSGSCLPTDVDTLEELIEYTSGKGACTDATYFGLVDGWYKDFHPYANRERNLGQATLLGGLLTFTTYQPFEDACKAEGLAYLYAVYYQTGTAWHERIFDIELTNVAEKITMGRGMALTPNLHLGDNPEGDGPKVFVQTSTGEIKEIMQKSTPFSVDPGKYKWKHFTGCP